MCDYEGWTVVSVQTLFERTVPHAVVIKSADGKEVTLYVTSEETLMPEEGDNVQLDLQQHLTSLDWVHGRDVSYYHRNCTGSVFAVEAFDNHERISECALCGIRISSTMSHPSVTYRDA